MIGKIPKTGKGFRGTFNYLVRGKRDAETPERLGWMETRNLFVEDYEKIPAMMRATAAQSKKCQKPVYHFLISWREDEAPADPTMRMVADRALSDLGLQDHQTVLAAHRDTAHRHLHIMVNRVHPETGKAWHTGKDWERLERSIARQAMELGFLKVEGRHNTPEKMAREAKRARDAEYQMATRKDGRVPLDRWGLEEVRSRRAQLGPMFEQARSWDHLERLLSAEGLSISAKGQGLVIDDGIGFMKLSDLRKELRLNGLESLFSQRFADFDRRRALERQLTRDQAPAPTEERPHIRRARKKPDKTSESEEGGATAQHPRRDKPEDITREDRERDEEERDTQRREWRAQRLAAGPQRTLPSTGSADEDSPPHRELPPATQTPAEPSPRQDAFAGLAGAHQKLDLSRKLHDMGLISKQDLNRAQNEVDAARQEVAKHQTLSEFVSDGVRDALAGVGKPTQQSAPSNPPPENSKPPKHVPKRKRNDERER
ncbi:relaxase/mobilization nuclease domain-containing protein [Hyphomicrobium sp. DMF-1]|uniref:relaxase/mobilization nuclease domain-containing protein n=1 Tax=Hyphomicrobium sp. DMF-1 TaxID=3019544 RepID=UPI0022EBC13B|nr:relaxase/mobilization nuclease domain-containing protein [Hyphomicrobium sp. DMF-1]WBT37698.1 relaxase/mobilization nuclease domain-containing protein [Hyphomicrobium sp. DMF-1]